MGWEFISKMLVGVVCWLRCRKIEICGIDGGEGEVEGLWSWWRSFTHLRSVFGEG
jgi:hypothetical protein